MDEVDEIFQLEGHPSLHSEEFPSLLDQNASDNFVVNDKPINYISIDNDDDSLNDCINNSRETDLNSKSQYLFPKLENCILQWNKVFPWVSFSKEWNALLCNKCKDLLITYFPSSLKKAIIYEITKPDDVFLVGRFLRQHEDSSSHLFSHMVSTPDDFVQFGLIYKANCLDFSSTDKLVQVVRGLLPHSSVDVASFKKITMMVANMCEKLLIKNIKLSKYFSVVADQCRGLVIIRFLNKDNSPEEHLIWSYISIWDKTPLQYLLNLGLDFEKMVIYIANTPCQQCKRCFTNRTTPANLPPRAPSSLSFGNLLWNLDFLKPFSSVIVTLCTLWKFYIHKFSKYFPSSHLDDLLWYYTSPSALIPVFEKFDIIRDICADIHQRTFRLDALGVTLVSINMDEKHKKVLMLLQEILDITKVASQKDKTITKIEIMKLTQAYNSLKVYSRDANFVTTKDPLQTCSTSAKCNNDKILEFLYLVEKYVDENQKCIYYNGKENSLPFFSLCDLEALIDSDTQLISKSKIADLFNRVYEAMSPFISVSNQEETIQCLYQFYSFIKSNNKSMSHCLEGLQLFEAAPLLKSKYENAYAAVLLMAIMPFQPCKIARSLFGSYVIEQNIQNCGSGAFSEDIKPMMLYLRQELPLASHVELVEMWFDSLGTHVS